MSRYRKYRKTIKGMSDDDFGKKEVSTTLEEDMRAATASVIPSKTPYELFRKSRIKNWTVRIVLAVLLIVAMLVWLYFLKGRM